MGCVGERREGCDAAFETYRSVITQNIDEGYFELLDNKLVGIAERQQTILQAGIRCVETLVGIGCELDNVAIARNVQSDVTNFINEYVDNAIATAKAADSIFNAGEESPDPESDN
jgi:hypothetical protein